MPGRIESRRSSESGQAITEYILLLVIVLVLAAVVREGLARMRFADRALSPLNREFRYVYQYGHGQARGYTDGGPKKHPRATEGDGSFRLFLNPGAP